eukprot:1002028-Pelagomonas_calceolata.AAC.14
MRTHASGKGCRILPVMNVQRDEARVHVCVVINSTLRQCLQSNWCLAIAHRVGQGAGVVQG